MKNLYWIFISCFLLNITVKGQDAIDFSATDTEGNNLELYSSYLDQGKAVLIKFFFTSCPPCASYAPHMEPLYQQWSAGDSVEFLLITNKNFDDNERINTYRTNNGYTFPAISSESTALDIFDTYANGPWGTAFGTPLFVVISPNGEVNFNIRGNGVQGTLAAINQALADAFSTDTIPTDTMPTDTMSTDTMSVDTMPTIDTIRKINKDIVTFNPVPDRLAITYEFPNSAPMTENVTTGAIIFRPDSISENDTFSIRAEYTGSMDALNGISTWDIALIQLFALQLDTPTIEEFIRADVNEDGRISGSDMVELRKLILGLSDSLPFGVKPLEYYPSFINSWSDVANIPKAYDFPAHFDLLDTLNDTLGFIGFRIGDINSSFNLETNEEISDRQASAKQFTTAKTSEGWALQSNNHIRDLNAFQLDIIINQDHFQGLEFHPVLEGNVFYNFISPDQLRILFYNARGADFTSGETLLMVKSNEKQLNVQSAEWIEQWENFDLEFIQKSPVTSVYPTTNDGLFYVESVGKTVIKIYDNSGTLIRTKQLVPGINRIQLKDVPKGFYIINDDSNLNAKIIIQ